MAGQGTRHFSTSPPATSSATSSHPLVRSGTAGGWAQRGRRRIVAHPRWNGRRGLGAAATWTSARGAGARLGRRRSFGAPAKWSTWKRRRRGRKRECGDEDGAGTRAAGPCSPALVLSLPSARPCSSPPSASGAVARPSEGALYSRSRATPMEDLQQRAQSGEATPAGALSRLSNRWRSGGGLPGGGRQYGRSEFGISICRPHLERFVCMRDLFVKCTIHHASNMLCGTEGVLVFHRIHT